MAQHDVILDGLATYRITRLITTDEITRPVREALVERLEATGRARAAYLLQCPVCMSMWVGMGVAVAPYVLGRAWQPARVALSASAVVMLIEELT
jgi:hypothetical protein